MNVLVLGRAEDTTDYIRYAHSRGLALTFVEPPPLPAGDPDAHRRGLVEAVAKEVDLAGFDDVVSFHDGLQIHVELLRAELGHRTRPLGAVATLTDKTRFKAHPALRGHIARYLELPVTGTAADALNRTREVIDFPLVLKPSNGFYSAGVVRVEDEAGFARALSATRRVVNLLDAGRGSGRVLAEEYLAGDEYAVDGIVSGGLVQPLILHRKRPPLVGPYFHETAYLTEPFDPDRGAGFATVLDAVLPAVGLDDSPFHAEFRYGGDGRLRLLEIAPRLSGGGATAAHLLDICTGLDAYGLLHRLNGGAGPVRAEPTRHRTGLEFDASATQSGFLHGMDSAVAVCHAHGATAVLRHRADGEFVLAPPLNLETVLTAFFEQSSLDEAESLLSTLIHECVIRTTNGVSA
ncbi:MULTISPECIES: ATP-grasp domain-containing protein [unclassified Micromonospora]|uniref:ATP-grasp domain-containing protein n=1 Tax=unclassified Micromonospora TaxID=2617518 RepID=UPI003320812E